MEIPATSDNIPGTLVLRDNTGGLVLGSLNAVGQIRMGVNTFVRDYASGYNVGHTPTSPQEIGRLTFAGNFQNISIFGEIRGGSQASVGVCRFILNLRSDTLPSKSITLFENENIDMGRLINVRVYENTSTGLVVIGYSCSLSLQNIGWSLRIQERANYNYFQQVTALTALDTTGLTEITATPTVSNVWSTSNTTVDANGFIKQASPIVRLFSDKITVSNDFTAEFERLGTGSYLVKNPYGFAKAGWFIETPKDANGGIKVFVEYQELPNKTIEIKTYTPMFEGGPVTAGDPCDIPEGRWIDLRLQMPPREIFAE